MRATLRTLALWAVLVGLVLNGTGWVPAFAFCHPRNAAACAPKACHTATAAPCCCAPTTPPSDVQADAQPAATEQGTMVVRVVIATVSGARVRHGGVRVSCPRLPEVRRVGRGRAPPVLSASLS